ncbi:methylmalonyl-CoA mutase family protein [Actinoplanes sp. N902-109]|uniref:methylmalonyl-CoA mutase family protein n=1 Tax=Actinoplanes sp. (strain N902-109) TaxID=649831 RepID=UPI000329382F|nr:methylmalonyl-CoA mutase family protein [Actinoplanes sp. N902-109]AGL15975.1 methylmalonyl-CoA mutase [Actinoplanes sp. N902-109]
MRASTPPLNPSSPGAASQGSPAEPDFRPGTRHQWRERVAAALNRTAPERNADAGTVELMLTTTTEDGVALRPLYTSEDRDAAPMLAGRRPPAYPGSWDLRQRHADPDPSAACAAIADDLAHGTTSLWLVVGAGAVPLPALARVLEAADDAAAPVGVHLDAGWAFESAARELLRRRTPRGSLGADPLGLEAATGEVADSVAAVRLAEHCAEAVPGLRSYTVNGLVYHEAGAGHAQELGCSLAAAVAYLRELTDAGLSVDDACGQLDFRFAASVDQFGTIAKLRAARALWTRVTTACGASPPARRQRQHAVTSMAMTTARDPWGNVLRGTVACFAAGAGGADAITVLPYDVAFAVAGPASRRLARNTTAILVDEVHTARVADPAAGSWFVEALTTDLARAAWALFTEIEGAGGLGPALRTGLVAGHLATSRARREQDVAHRRRRLIGVTDFVAPADPPGAKPGPAAGEPAAAQPGGLPAQRWAEPFERLRALADQHAARTGARPCVFLATPGPSAEYSARRNFAANLLAAGGIAVVDSGSTVDPAEMVRLFRDSGTAVACLASTDKLYAEHAAELVRALRSAGARRVLLTGPAQATAGFAGLPDGVLAEGMDVLATLRRLHLDLGIPQEER